EVDLDAVWLVRRRGRLVLEVLERELHHRPDASVALQAVELFDRGDGIRGVLTEYAVDAARVEGQGVEGLLVCRGGGAGVAPAETVARDVGELNDLRLLDRRDRCRGRRRARRGGLLRGRRLLGDELAPRGRRRAVVTAGYDHDRADRGRTDQDRRTRDET